MVEAPRRLDGISETPAPVKTAETGWRTTANKDMVISTLIICLSLGSYFLATSLQNVAITDSSELGPEVGYISGGAYYATSAIGAVMFPALYKRLNRVVLTIGALFSYLMFYAAMFILTQGTVYLGSVLAGFGGSIIFILSLKSIADNSSRETLQRNMSIFWAAVSGFNVINNFINYFYIQNLKRITDTIRLTVYGTLAGLCVVAMVLALFGPKDKKKEEKEEGEVYGHKNDPETGAKSSVTLSTPPKPTKSFTESAIQYATESLAFLRKISKRRSVWIITIYQFFSGTLWGYLQKSLPASIGVVFDKRGVINLSGLVIGVCTMVGALAFKKLSDLTNNTVCVCLMMVMSVAACVLSYLIFPYDANLNLTPTGSVVLSSEEYYIVIISMLLALTDTGFNVLGFSVAALMFEGDSATAFAFLDTTFCIGNGVMITLAGFINLHAYMVLLAVLTIITGIGFIVGLRKYIVQLEKL